MWCDPCSGLVTLVASWKCCSASWASCAIAFSFLVLMRLRVTVDQVQQRKQEQPPNIDEVPVEPEVFNRRDVPRAEVASLCPPQQPEQQPEADDHRSEERRV